MEHLTTQNDSGEARASREERMEIIRLASREFKRGDKINWKSAFLAHPEWRVKLGATTKAGTSRFYAFASFITRKLRKNSRALVPARGRQNAFSAEPTPVAAAPITVVAGVSHCPGCGMALEMHNQVALTLQQMQQSHIMQVLQQMSPEDLLRMAHQAQSHNNGARTRRA